ncbi:MAG: 16S rRNA (guanine(527)-N(7))-methyltransferase RsmG [Bacteroidota bacterium]
MDNYLSKYFNDLPVTSIDKLNCLKKLYAEWNKKINLVSRKDMDNFFLHHVIHSLSIVKIISFSRGTRILDAGTGGGLPGIPLAIVFPHCYFTLADSVRKKITAVNDIISKLDLDNAEAIWSRVENIKEKYDFAVARAVAPLPDLVRWTGSLIHKKSLNEIPNGLISLKGGELSEEIKNYPECRIYKLNDFFDEEYFREKKIVYIPL